MEDDLHIPHLQTEYLPTYGEPHFSTAHSSEPPLMPSHTQQPHFEQPDTIHYSPILIIHHLLSSLLYMSFRSSFMLCTWTFMTREMILLACVDHLMRARIGTTQLSAIHHHHAKMVAIHDLQFMSLETCLDDFETRLD